jgi:hypothetical protein
MFHGPKEKRYGVGFAEVLIRRRSPRSKRNPSWSGLEFRAKIVSKRVQSLSEIPESEGPHN